MADLLDVLNALSMPLKLEWALWVACAMMLLVSHRMLKVVPRATLPAPAPVRRPAVPMVKPVVAAAAPVAHDTRDAVIAGPVAPGAPVIEQGMASVSVHGAPVAGPAAKAAKKRRRAPVPTPAPSPEVAASTAA